MQKRYAALMMIWMTPLMAFAQVGTSIGHGAIAGVITDSARTPLTGVVVAAAGARTPAFSDSSGRFHLERIPSGNASVTVRRLGYRPVSFEIDLLPESTVVVQIRLRRVQVLEPVDVTAEPFSRRFIATGFEHRQRLGIGSFISPARIDSQRPHLLRTTDLLRNVRGIELRCGAASCRVMARREPKCLQLFVDGAHIDDSLDMFVPPSRVYAIEIYERPGLVPTEFQGKLPRKTSALTIAAGCGAIAVWTLSRK